MTTWHAVYGKYAIDEFRLIFHFIVDEMGRVRKCDQQLDTLFLNASAKALRTAYDRLRPLTDTVEVRFNHYIRQNPDQTHSVWILPAFQPNQVAVYGGEFSYRIDAGGSRILQENNYFQGAFRGFKVTPPREIWLNYKAVEKPTQGAVFFAWYYRNYFTRINIETASSVSTLLPGSDDWTWMHVEKDQGNSQKK